MSKFVWLLVAAVIAPGCASAGARPAEALIPAMPLGTPVLPPQGFADWCGREPEACLAGSARAIRASSGSEAGSRVTPSALTGAMWSQAFAAIRSPRPPAGATTVTAVAPERPAPSLRPSSGWRITPIADRGLGLGGYGASRASPALEVSQVVVQPLTLRLARPGRGGPASAFRLIASIDGPARYPVTSATHDVAPFAGKRRAEAGLPPVAAPPRAKVAEPRPPARDARAAPAVLTLAQITAVNRRINRGIRRGSDDALYGQADFWTRPSGPGAAGDCEDYVLAKRQALLDVGASPQALSIAVVRTRRGETHAVLLVATPAGEVVLDNLTPWVLPWTEAPYAWVERQRPGAPLEWTTVAAGPSEGTPAPAPLPVQTVMSPPAIGL